MMRKRTDVMMTTTDTPSAARYVTIAKHGNYTVTVEAPDQAAVEQTALTALAVVIFEQTGQDISDRREKIQVEHRILSADEDGLVVVSAAGLLGREVSRV